jgi:GMP synthase-like glutamine amidotransferase
MRRAIAIRHVAFEDLGSLAAVLQRRGFALAYRDATVDDLAAADIVDSDLLAVLGGPIGAYEPYAFLNDELRVIEKRLRAGKPVLGICLGGQLLARALGARVYRGNGKEIGWSPLTLTAAGRRSCLAPLGDGTPVLHWHGDTFDLPTCRRGRRIWPRPSAIATRPSPGSTMAWRCSSISKSPPPGSSTGIYRPCLRDRWHPWLFRADAARRGRAVGAGARPGRGALL